MNVVKHESNTKNVKNSFCYNEPIDTLQYSEEILNELNTTRKDSCNKYKLFVAEMEKIDSGDTSNLSAVKLDEYFGSLGLKNTHKVIEKQGRFYGVC